MKISATHIGLVLSAALMATGCEQKKEEPAKDTATEAKPAANEDDKKDDKAGADKKADDKTEEAKTDDKKAEAKTDDKKVDAKEAPKKDAKKDGKAGSCGAGACG